VPNGPAARAGLRGMARSPAGGVVPGDVIVAINGDRIDSTADYQRLVARFRPGDRVRVRVLRDEAEQEITVALQGV
jgi:serine protease Do